MGEMHVYGEHHTKVGKIVYREKRIRLFTGKDAVRIVTQVNNHGTGDYVAWRALLIMATRNCNALLENRSAKGVSSEYIKKYRRFLEVFDEVVNLAAVLLSNVPGCGWVVEAAAALYTAVRKVFPV